uniref:Kinesin motor domain-containing protein n=1 Tax=Rhodnius prolixus TaxID=13249 RepID=T1HEC3_RHOPR
MPMTSNSNSSGSSSDSMRKLIGSRGASPALPRSRGSEDEPLFKTNSKKILVVLNSFNDVLSNSSDWKHDPYNQEDNINVVVRVRPLNPREMKYNDGSVVEFPGNGQILLTGLNDVPGLKGTKTKQFSYNVVFEPGATQEDVLQYSGITRLIEMAVDGFSATAFCYGQTGSGKTHTLTGPPSLFNGKKVDINSEDHGLIFRAFLYLFKVLQDKSNVNFILKASFLEIYNEK